jgi:hypothetical protein
MLLLRAARPFRLARQHDEARGVVLGVGHVLLQSLKAINLRRQRCRQGRAANIARFRHFARCARGVGGDHGLDAERADDVAALAERVDMAFDRPDRFQRGAVRRHQLMLHWQEPLGDDVKPRARHQVMNISHASGYRIVDRNHAELGAPAAHSGECVLEGRTRQQRITRIGLLAGNLRVGAGLALECDLFSSAHHRRFKFYS